MTTIRLAFNIAFTAFESCVLGYQDSVRKDGVAGIDAESSRGRNSVIPDTDDENRDRK